MPVRFLCDNCRGLLSVGRKKIGAEIECPKCGAAMVVPEMEVAAAGLAMARSSRSGKSTGSSSSEADPFAEFAVFDEPDAELDPADAQPNATANGTAADPAPPGPPATAEKTEPANPAQRGPSAETPRRTPRWADEVEADAGNAPGPSRPRRSGQQRQAAPPAGGVPSALRRNPTFVRSPGSRMLLISRRVVYVQAVLFGVIALGAFVAGWLIGRGMPPAAKPDPEVAAAVETVLIQGTISYVSREGEARTDGGAVLIALPEGKLPESKLPTSGLGPLDAAPQATSPALLAIEELGGRYVRANADGQYSLVVPHPGRYRLLIISRHAVRLGGTPVDERDLTALRGYFTSAPVLIGRQKYALLNEDVPAGLYDKSHDFGVTGEL